MQIRLQCGFRSKNGGRSVLFGVLRGDKNVPQKAEKDKKTRVGCYG